MKRFLLAIIFLFSIYNVFSQDVERVEVLGKIYVDVDDLENVTVFNASSNKGTITDAEGNFKIKVALNDEIKFSAIQLIPFKAVVTQEVIDSKVFKIFLVERVNSLDEVVLLPHNLTGDLVTDVENVKLVDPVVFTFGSFNNYDFADDYHSGVENIATNQGQIKYQADGMAILALLINAVFKNKNKKNKKEYINPRLQTPISKLSQTFSDDYFVNNYNVPREKIAEFIVFLEDGFFDETLLNPDKEILLIEHLHQQSKLFLKSQSEKD